METTSDIATKQNYLCPSRYLSGRIIEYDLKAANISVLRDKNIIDQDRYIYLSNLPKIQREIEIGLMEKQNYDLYKILQEGICDAKRNLVSFNKIEDDQIVRVANDAVYINSDIDLKYLSFGEFVEFRPKSEYNVYCNLNGILVFCKFLDSGNINLDIKGLDSSNTVIEIHKNYMISIIASTIALIERSGIQDAIDYLSEVCARYIRRELPIEFYRELNKECSYRLIPMERLFTFGICNISESDKKYLDINYNYTILRELWSILLEIYSIQKR